MKDLTLEQMAAKAAKAFALQVPRDPPGFSPGLFYEYMRDVILIYLIAAAEGRYFKPDEGCVPLVSPVLVSEWRALNTDVPYVAPAPTLCAHFHHSHLSAEEAEACVKATLLNGMGATLDMGNDPDGPCIGLPERPKPEERPFVPNKFGEHGD